MLHSPLSHKPLKAIKLSLLSAASGLRTEPGRDPDILDLEAHAIFKNAVKSLRQISPLLALALSYVSLGLGFYKLLSPGVTVASAMQNAVEGIWSLFKCSVTVHAGNPMYPQLIAWISKQQESAESRRLILRDPRDYTRSENKNTLSYVPPLGSFKFTYKGVTFTCKEESSKTGLPPERFGQEPKTESDITISCSPIRNNQLIKSFLDHIKRENEDSARTRIYRVSNSATSWSGPISRVPRKLGTVAMDSSLKERIKNQIVEYRKPEVKAKYAQLGRPYRKGYLLWGPPGTGKTSLAVALAGEFDLPLHVLSLTRPKMCDSSLELLFEQLESDSIVVIEDVDSAGIIRENMSKSHSEGEKKPQGVTLSGLLNVIDGPASVENRILILTTNNKDSLDPALIRPGRIDHPYEVGNASRKVARDLFMTICTDIEDPLSHGISEGAIKTFCKDFKSKLLPKTPPPHGISGELKTLWKDFESKVLNKIPPSHGIYEEELSNLADDFASKVPDKELTPAEIQGFLWERYKDPRKAVDEIEDWVKSTTAKKASPHSTLRPVLEDDPVEEEALANPVRSWLGNRLSWRSNVTK